MLERISSSKESDSINFSNEQANFTEEKIDHGE